MAGPASIRANNPGNIKTGVQWLGVVGTTKVSEGVNDVFATPVYGARALAKNIEAKFDGRASNTNQLMNILSPSSENNTNGYVIPSVVNYMNENGYPNFTQYTPIADSFKNDQAFGTTYMQAITYMEQAGAEKAFPREVLEAGWKAKDKGDGQFDPYQFGDGSENGYEGPSGENIPREEEGEDTVSAKSGEGIAGTSAARNDAIAPASGGDFGFKDPDKTFSVQEYKDNQKTNVAARGEWQPKLKLPDGQPFEVPQDAQPEYPHNKVIESTNPNPEERHRMEIDDTSSEPRVTLVHKNGTGIEMMERDKLLVVNSSGRMVQLVGNDFEMFVAGNGTVIYKGNLDWTVEGDMNLTVKGNMETTVEGTKTEVVKKSVIEEYQDDQETTVTNNKSTTVGDKNTETILGDKNTFVKKKQSNWVNGNIEFLSGDNTHISSQTKTSISSPTVNMTSSTINIAAGGGTIGGPAVFYYGLSFEGDLFVDGNLTVDGAATIDGAISTSGSITSAGTLSTAGDITAFDPTSGALAAPTVAGTEAGIDGVFNYTAPTVENITTTLTASEEGIMQISIDPGDKIKQSIDLRERINLGLGLK